MFEPETYIFPKDWFYIFFFKKKKERRSSEGWQSWSHNVTGFSYSLREQQPTNFQFARKETELELCPRRHEVVCHSAGSLSYGILQQYKKNCIVLMISFGFLLRFRFTREDVNYHCDDRDVWKKKKRELSSKHWFSLVASNTKKVTIWNEDREDEGCSRLSGPSVLPRCRRTLPSKASRKTLGLNVLFALSCFPQGNVSERRYSAASSVSVDGDEGTDCGLSPRREFIF